MTITDLGGEDVVWWVRRYVYTFTPNFIYYSLGLASIFCSEHCQHIQLKKKNVNCITKNLLKHNFVFSVLGFRVYFMFTLSNVCFSLNKIVLILQLSHDFILEYLRWQCESNWRKELLRLIYKWIFLTGMCSIRPLK